MHIEDHEKGFVNLNGILQSFYDCGKVYFKLDVCGDVDRMRLNSQMNNLAMAFRLENNNNAQCRSGVKAWTLGPVTLSPILLLDGLDHLYIIQNEYLKL